MLLLQMPYNGKGLRMREGRPQILSKGNILERREVVPAAAFRKENDLSHTGQHAHHSLWKVMALIERVGMFTFMPYSLALKE